MCIRTTELEIMTSNKNSPLPRDGVLVWQDD